MRRFLTIASMGLLLVACEGRPEDVPSALEVKQDSSSIQGTYRHGEDIVQFRSRETQPGVFDVVVDVHGMTLSALVDRNRQVAEVDGFAAGATTESKPGGGKDDVIDLAEEGLAE